MTANICRRMSLGHACAPFVSNGSPSVQIESTELLSLVVGFLDSSRRRIYIARTASIPGAFLLIYVLDLLHSALTDVHGSAGRELGS
jgi:hypothetical protein